MNFSYTQTIKKISSKNKFFYVSKNVSDTTNQCKLILPGLRFCRCKLRIYCRCISFWVYGFVRRTPKMYRQKENDRKKEKKNIYDRP